MKKLSLFCFAIIIFLVALGPKYASAQAANTQNFYIPTFRADYFLSKDANNVAVLKVTEDISVQFPDYDQNHGILRALPQTYKGHSLNLKIDNVSDSYTTSVQNQNLVLKIGDPYSYVHGLKSYEIQYEERDVTDPASAGDIFFWNTNGSQWHQLIGHLDANVYFPKDLGNLVSPNIQCYVGKNGSKNQTRCSQLRPTTDQAGNIVYGFSTDNLAVGEQLSFKFQFPKGTFALDQSAIDQQRLTNGLHALELMVSVALLVAVFIYMFKRWRKFGDDPKGRGVIVPQYEPPKGLTVLYSDFILHEKLRGKAMAATIIDLAVHKYITIKEIDKKWLLGKKDYELVINDLPSNLNEQSQRVLAIIFNEDLSAGAAVRISDFHHRVKNDTSRTIFEQIKGLESKISASLYSLGYFIQDPKKIKTKYQWISTAIVIGGFATGVYWVNKFQVNGLYGLVSFSFLLVVSIFLTGVLVMIFASILPARSLSGVEARDELLGLRDYMKLAEADRIKYLQSPQVAQKVLDKSAFNPTKPALKIELFETLLPYAMLFDLEKDWAKQFKDIYTKPPDWYQGNWNTFNTIYLTNSISSFSTSSGLSFSSPSSSGGFSGGGAGGGGGGGGGGGW